MFSIYFKFPTLQIQSEPQLCGTNRETDAAVLSLNESFFSLCGVLCAAEVFVVPGAFDKASCSSLAKSGTSPQGPQVGVGSPAALCPHFIIWKHTHTHTYTWERERERNTYTQWGFIFPYIDLQALH